MVTSTGAARAARGAPPAARRVLVYRLGSLGDTAVALPVFHLIERAFPGAERRVLTNVPVADVAAPLQSVLWPGFAESCIAYPVGLRAPGELRALAGKIRVWRPDVLVYALEPRGMLRTLRDAIYFRSCSVRGIVGLPLGRAARPAGPDGDGLWESEGARLARALASLGDARRDDPASWAFGFTSAERAAAHQSLSGWAGAAGFVAFGIGTKLAEKDWGDARWAATLDRIGRPDLGLALVGAAADAKRAAKAAARWPGPVLNLCGRLAPRESGLVIAAARLYLGPDSGPMHFAAAVGTPAVAVFSTHRPPGVWFPHGAQHRVFYPGLAWSGGMPVARRAAAGERTIADIPPDAVAAACYALLAAAPQSAGQDRIEAAA